MTGPAIESLGTIEAKKGADLFYAALKSLDEFARLGLARDGREVPKPSGKSR